MGVLLRDFDIQIGDRVLVHERNGKVWHTVKSVEGDRITTKECPQPFSTGFVVSVDKQRKVA